MNSPLEHDFDGFGFSSNSKIPEGDPNTELQILEKQIDIAKPLECIPEELPQCEICTQKFLNKKELQSHITIHLGQPRIILKRCNSGHKNRKRDREVYSLNQEKAGSLKLTLKKRNHSDFTVINRNFNITTDISRIEEVAEVERNAQTPEEKIEGTSSTNDRDENLTLNNEEDDNVDDEDDDKLSDDNDRPSLEANEGDSGVGSDMANPLEKEDQNVDDIPVEENYEDDKIEETEDVEESDALEATCRETIENLKKLGEQSNCSRSALVMSPRDPNPESSMTSSPSVPEESVDDELPLPETSQQKDTSNFSWMSDKDVDQLAKQDDENTDDITDANPDGANSLLQTFLLEHHRKNQNTNEVISIPVETEYVSLEKLAETVNTCRVCSEKFRDITLLDEHKAIAGHYQCNIPDCSILVFKTRSELINHKTQVHGTPLSPSINLTHVTRSSPQLSEGSPGAGHNSPHGISIDPSNSHITRTSPQTHSPTYVSATTNQIIPPVNFEQLPAPVQQLAQQVQRMPLPQQQMSSSLPPGMNTMIPGPNYYMQPPGRPPPPIYRAPAGHQAMQYAPHVAAYLQSQYSGVYQQYQNPQMQMQQPMPRVRYPSVMPTPRGPRLPQGPSIPRQRLKRPQPPPPPPPQPPSMQSRTVDQQLASKQRRMDVLVPDRNEDADCHVIVQQKRNDGLPVIQNVQGSTNQLAGRNDSTIHLTDSITLSVRQPGVTSGQVTATPATTAKKTDAKAVANVLAARGITVTPATNKNKSSDQQQKQVQSQQLQQQQSSSQPQQSSKSLASSPSAVNVTALNLNSAISIIPAQKKQSQQQSEQSGQFAVPQNKQNKSASQEVERPPRPPTVDLTQDIPEPNRVIRRGRPPRTTLICQICEKTFANQEILIQHMATHRTTNKLSHKCNLCSAQYPNAQALAVHKQTYHKDVESSPASGGTELAIPVVDLKSPQALNRLQSLGIHTYIPLSQLSAQTGGYFGLPIITIDGPRNQNSCNLGALGATSILSLGPLKHLSNR